DRTAGFLHRVRGRVRRRTRAGPSCGTAQDVDLRSPSPTEVLARKPAPPVRVTRVSCRELCTRHDTTGGARRATTKLLDGDDQPVTVPIARPAIDPQWGVGHADHSYAHGFDTGQALAGDAEDVAPHVAAFDATFELVLRVVELSNHVPLGVEQVYEDDAVERLVAQALPRQLELDALRRAALSEPEEAKPIVERN